MTQKKVDDNWAFPPVADETENNILYGDKVINNPGKVEVEREVYSLDKQLVEDIEDFITRKKRQNVMIYDVISNKEKRINKSLWVRKVLQKALNDEGYYLSLIHI